MKCNLLPMHLGLAFAATPQQSLCVPKCAEMQWKCNKKANEICCSLPQCSFSLISPSNNWPRTSGTGRLSPAKERDHSAQISKANLTRCPSASSCNLIYIQSRLQSFNSPVLCSGKVALAVSCSSNCTHPMISFLYQLLLADYAYLLSLPFLKYKQARLTCHTYLRIITVVTWKWKELCAKSEDRRRRHKKRAVNNLKKLSSIKTLLKLGWSGRKRRSKRTSTYVYI